MWVHAVLHNVCGLWLEARLDPCPACFGAAGWIHGCAVDLDDDPALPVFGNGGDHAIEVDVAE
jgi:hypothetical protein